MKVRALAFLALSLLGGSTSASTVPPPTKVPAPLTGSQEAKLQEGVALHDAGRYADAVVVYEAILQENPDAAQVGNRLFMRLNEVVGFVNDIKPQCDTFAQPGSSHRTGKGRYEHRPKLNEPVERSFGSQKFI